MKPLLATLALVVIAVAGCGEADSGTAERPRFLYSIPAAAGSLAGPSDTQLTLHLTGTRDYLTQFTDRPLREAFIVDNADFARRFTRLFPDSNPNAALTYTPSGTAIPVSIVLTIGAPTWDAERGAWTMPATRIRKQLRAAPGSTFPGSPPDIGNPRSFRRGTLVIDDSIDNGEQAG